MYAQCPQCEAVFEVRATQLRAARGWVRCGACMESFQALEHLRDPEELGLTLNEPALSRKRPREVPLPAVLREDFERLRTARAESIRTWAFGIGSLLAGAAIVAQATWFDPRGVSQSYPQAREYVVEFCELAGCVLPEQRDVGRIRVVNRDVRVHPRFEGALRILVSFVNEAPFAQRHPDLRFTLFNVNGQIIATRVFSPAQYLGRAVAPDERLQPDRPIQASLEVISPEEVAVSFEFAFL